MTIHSSLSHWSRASFQSQSQNIYGRVRSSGFHPRLKWSQKAVNFRLSRSVFLSRQASRCLSHSLTLPGDSYPTRCANRFPPCCTSAQHQTARSSLSPARNNHNWSGRHIHCKRSWWDLRTVGRENRCKLSSRYNLSDLQWRWSSSRRALSSSHRLYAQYPAYPMLESLRGWIAGPRTVCQW